MTEIQDHFKIGDDEGGLLQTAFVLSYMVFAPLFGYLGDRYSRKWIMVLGVSLWSTTTLLGSYMDHFGWFITFRALVGIGEASYSTIAPTIISDLFVGEMRSRMLALFYFAIPVGSGLGYIVGAKMASIMNSWVWSLRVTPVLGAIAVVLIVMLRDPQRGQSEGTHHMQTTSYKEDVKAIMRNRSFMLSTAGFTCVAFVTGALAWWGPKFIHLGLISQPGNEHVTLNDVSYKFGTVAMVAGLIGVPLGTLLSSRLRPHYRNADPLICAAGLITSSPLVYLGLVVVKYSGGWCFTLVFFAEVALNLSWPIVADMLLVSNGKQRWKRGKSKHQEAYTITKDAPADLAAVCGMVSFIFGAITMTTGIIGVPLGSYLSQRLNAKNVKADPYICATGLLLSAPLLVGAMFSVRANIYATYALIFFGELALNLNWAIVADILLYVVVPTRRSTAEAFQILISHAFGDAGSPYFVGVISESIKRVLRIVHDAAATDAYHPSVESSSSHSIAVLSQLAENSTVAMLQAASPPAEDSPLVQFRALQYALFSTCFVEILGGVFFLVTAFYIDRDRARVEAVVLGCQLELSESSGSDGNGTDDGQRSPVGGPAGSTGGSSSAAFSAASTIAAS
uniref:Major facilitator superfamily (MFS) profile domain-containing protein n=1 Tax=Anopheles melas TaxID=34690 RepID=A0A182ULB0_9DIPT